MLGDSFSDAEILLLSIFPRGKNEDDEILRQVVETNDLIVLLSERKNVTWLELWDVFLSKDGTISTEVMPDALHPTEVGYRIWAREMAPTLKKLMKKASRP